MRRFAFIGLLVLVTGLSGKKTYACQTDSTVRNQDSTAMLVNSSAEPKSEDPITYHLFFTGHGNDVYTGPGGGVGLNYYLSNSAFIRVNTMVHWDHLVSESQGIWTWRATHLSIPLELAATSMMYGYRGFRFYVYTGPVLQFPISRNADRDYPGTYQRIRIGASIGGGFNFGGFGIDVGMIATKQYKPEGRVMFIWEFL